MGKFQFAIDRGGTFTDIWARCPDGKTKVLKLLSEDPSNYSDAPREGIRRIIEEVTGKPCPIKEPVDASQIEWIRMGTTVATNALLERKGERMALVITAGFRDLLQIGNQARPNLFDLAIRMPEMLYEEVIEVKERIVLHTSKCQIKKQCSVATGKTNTKVELWQVVDKEAVRRDLQSVLDKGIKSIAVVFMHSYLYSEHEEQVGALAREMGFASVSLSSDVMPMIRIVPRGFTACADAYLTLCIKRYVSGFSKGFKNLEQCRVLFMQSDGGLTPVDKFCGSRAILSGPAGGVVGYAQTTVLDDSANAVIGFDMGGTSTDVSRYAGSLEHVFESTTAGITIQAPQLDINTVAAGGGSRLFFRSGMFVVGPESAGADPGPVCYRKGGPLTITDANLVLGRLMPEYFPKIFGPNENDSLDVKATQEAFEKLTKEVNEFQRNQSDSDKKEMSVQQVAMGFVRVANESMCRPIRALTQARGYDTSKHVLACFGGAGGQHACAVAKSLGIKTIYIHRYSGILSAFGLALADVVHEAQQPSSASYKPESFDEFDDLIDRLTAKCVDELQSQGFSREDIETEEYLHMRYDRTDCALMVTAAKEVSKDKHCRHGDFLKSFEERYKQEFGFIIPDREVLVDDVRVRGIGRSRIDLGSASDKKAATPTPEKTAAVYFEEGLQDTPVYTLESLTAGIEIAGPAVIIDRNSTMLVEPQCVATMTDRGDIVIKVTAEKQVIVGTDLDAIQLSIFSHRFMSIAEQMGRVLQRTAISTNIKERLDFSCALFGPNGGLVANAPHIPVHLGAMQEAVQYQMRAVGSQLKDGDVLLSNHPTAGGSHLPDLTVITPVFYKGVNKPVFFVASRGHHADIGGITPGSMPPHSKTIFEEGAVFKSFFLVRDGHFQEKEVSEELKKPGDHPGSSGTRNLGDNISDLRAQVAANKKGISLVQELIDEYGLDVVQAYMGYIQSNAEVAVRDMMKGIAEDVKERTGTTRLSAIDQMDDGSVIKLTVDIDEKEGTATLDFSGTGVEVYNNWNSPKAVCLSAVIYCLRCMVGHDIPLNEGCLKPVKIVIPKGCLLNPSETAAVVGGNVLTSQRIVDVIFKAFQTCAASQGCMNNITFGDDEFGYYETVAGGAGAGPSWVGHSGVHTHMTNTRITDPEVLEFRYPVILQRFHLNKHTGGKGANRGGDGVVRELLFRKDLTLSILTERRVFQPYGLKGGEPGNRGLNLLTYPDGRQVNIGGKTSVPVSAGCVFSLLTPGGGGYGGEGQGGQQSEDGSRVKSDDDKVNPKSDHWMREKGSVHEYRRTQEAA